jgi:hypothetical protein
MKIKNELSIYFLCVCGVINYAFVLGFVFVFKYELKRSLGEKKKFFSKLKTEERNQN